MPDTEDRGRAYEAAVLAELLAGSGWRVLKGRLAARLETVRRGIHKGVWVTPDQLRRLSYLQGEEAFLDALTGDNAAKVFESLAAAEPVAAAEEVRVAPGRKALGRARPVGE